MLCCSVHILNLQADGIMLKCGEKDRLAHIHLAESLTENPKKKMYVIN